MKNFWTIEKLGALAPVQLEKVRQNATREHQDDLRKQIEEIQASRKPIRKSSKISDLSPAVGFHFVCPDDYEVEQLRDGRFWTGVWAIASRHCDPAVDMKGYVALHKSRAVRSHRQGTVVGWREEQRTKGAKQVGISFLVVPFAEPLPWFGGGSGEKGIRRVADLPPWTPRV